MLHLCKLVRVLAKVAVSTCLSRSSFVANNLPGVDGAQSWDSDILVMDHRSYLKLATSRRVGMCVHYLNFFQLREQDDSH